VLLRKVRDLSAMVPNGRSPVRGPPDVVIRVTRVVMIRVVAAMIMDVSAPSTRRSLSDRDAAALATIAVISDDGRRRREVRDVASAVG